MLPNKFASTIVSALTLGMLAFGSLHSAWAASSERLLYRFTGGYDGGAPYSNLVFDAAGNLYGTVSYGGTGVFYGAVFELSPTSRGLWKEKILYSFKGGKDASYPTAGVVFDNHGNLFGTTDGGGSAGFGTVFELAANAGGHWQEKILYNFEGSSHADGQYPHSGLIFDPSGNLVGTTQLGGPSTTTCPNGCGTVFKLTSTGAEWQESVLYAFTGQNGDGAGVPYGVVFDKRGDLYGTTEQGGNNEQGIVYSLVPSGQQWAETILYSFKGDSDGASPSNELTLDTDGNIYGTTAYGGTAGYGTAFELSRSQGAWNESILFNFDVGSTGGFPVGKLLIDSKRNLYGVNSAGGCCGNVYELSPSSKQEWTETVLHTFEGGIPDGSMPLNGLVPDRLGRLYGTTAWGGYGPCSGGLGCGVVFTVRP
jgi:uncharacterized repeat protein (TIGR03803 family)